MPSKADVQKSLSFLSEDKPQSFWFSKIYLWWNDRNLSVGPQLRFLILLALNYSTESFAGRWLPKLKQ